MKQPQYYYSHSWQMNFYFYVGWKWTDFVKSMKRLDHDLEGKTPGEGLTVTMWNYKGKYTGVHVWIASKRDVSVIAHECLHAVNFTMEMRDVIPSWTNDEPQAYLLTALIRKALL